MARVFPEKKKEEVPKPEAQSQTEEPKEEGVVIERVIDLKLINDKLNYITGILHKIAEKAEIDLSQ